VKRALLAALLLWSAAVRPGQAADVTPAGLPSAPIATEHRYRLSAAIRPLFFWIGASNVGGARIVWREDGEGRRGYELLLGSDPARAPRRVNRWGWVREDADPSGATMFGVMNRSEDDNLAQAKARLQRDGGGGYLFKMIRARIEGNGAQATSTVVYAPTDFTFRQLEDLQRYAEATKPAPRVRTGQLPEGTRPGLLFALADLVRAGVEAGRGAADPEPRPRTVQFTFDARVYDLVLSSWERVNKARYGASAYEKLVRLEFESRNRERGNTEHFILVCGTEGPLSGVPVFVRYQPKWWFKVEGVLDETEGL
jgi:hypothetical protein